MGSARFGTKYRRLDSKARNFDGDELLPVDLAANARSYGVDVVEITAGPDAIADLKDAVAAAKAKDSSTVIHINSDPSIYAPDGEGWWDVPVAAVSTVDTTQRARVEYLEQQRRQKSLIG
jgi:3D-(3,5/4)-trihydroxycyclohexane-1,2-dione acylhydrolase (decyclizing)